MQMSSSPNLRKFAKKAQGNQTDHTDHTDEAMFYCTFVQSYYTYYSTTALLCGLFLCSLHYFFLSLYLYILISKLTNVSRVYYFVSFNSLRCPIQWSCIMLFLTKSAFIVFFFGFALFPGCSESYCFFLTEYTLLAVFFLNWCLFRAPTLFDKSNNLQLRNTGRLLE